MIPRKLSRLRQVDLRELTWRAREKAEIALHQVAAKIRPPRWDRRHLSRLLARDAALAGVDDALRAERWHDAHVGIAAYLQTQPARFVIASGMRERLATEIGRRFPTAVNDARTRAERMLNGRYDLLGYTDLPFDGCSWHRDPVHDKSAPMHFWSKVPYLSPDCGDHKVTWEFNRHQHWIELGRAFWLTGDPRYRAECLRQLETWLATNPPLMGMNWASMLELGFRSMSWVWALNFFVGDAESDTAPWSVDLLLALDRQLTQVERHLSYYFSPNTHLLGEALALYVCGRALPALKASARREATGRRVLLQEIARQIAADGGHCERSPHYHRYTLDFYLLALTIARLTDDPSAGLFERACARLAQAAAALADDQGLLPQIGDDDGGSLLPITRRRPDDVRDSLAIAAALTGHVDLLISEPHEEFWWMLGHDRFADARTRIERSPRRVQPTSTALPATGYYISRNEHGDHLIVDGGSHGYLNGGHAHADALSATFTHRGRPLLIDPGTGVYTIDLAVRDRFRSSAFHNTLTLDGRSQSLPRGPFHWDHVANASTRRWRMNRQFDYFSGAHDGYAPFTHWRHVLMLHNDLLVVADCVIAEANFAASQSSRPDAPGDSRQASVHWHLHPEWSVDLGDQHATLVPRQPEVLGATAPVDLHVAGGTLQRHSADASTGLGWYAPAYGRIEPTTTLSVNGQGRLPLWIVSAFGLGGANRIRNIALEPVDTSGDVPHHAVAIRIDRERAIDRVVIAEPADDQRHLRWRAGEFDADARMLYTREVDGELSIAAWADGTTLRSGRYPYAERSHGTRVADLYVDLSPEQAKRKAS